MPGAAFEVRKAASSAGFAGERPDDGPACGGLGMGHSPANPTLLAAFLTSEASPSIQTPDFGMDIAKIRNLLEILQNLRLCSISDSAQTHVWPRWQPKKAELLRLQLLD